MKNLPKDWCVKITEDNILFLNNLSYSKLNLTPNRYFRSKNNSNFAVFVSPPEGSVHISTSELSEAIEKSSFKDEVIAIEVQPLSKKELSLSQKKQLYNSIQVNKELMQLSDPEGYDRMLLSCKPAYTTTGDKKPVWEGEVVYYADKDTPTPIKVSSDFIMKELITFTTTGAVLQHVEDSKTVTVTESQVCLEKAIQDAMSEIGLDLDAMRVYFKTELDNLVIIKHSKQSNN